MIERQYPLLVKRLILALAGAVGLFALLAMLVASGVTVPFDESTLRFINTYANVTLDNIIVFVTQLGGVYVISAIVAAVSLYFLIRKQYYKALFVVVSVGGVALINTLLKTLFERARPDLWEWLVTEQSFSFPSGHSVASMALAISIIGVLWYTRWRTTALIGGAIYVVAIGASRMYLGVHYPTDVLGGWLLGIAWVSFIAVLVHSYRNRKNHRKAA